VVQPVKVSAFGKIFGGGSTKIASPQKSSLGTPDKEGWLSKQGLAFLKAWQRRWFILKEDTLYYFKDKEVSYIF
jgi:hypothetical protein